MALRAEDRRIAGHLAAARGDAGHPRRRASVRVGRGLAYGLYETTFVYIIWRAWMKAGTPAALDWTVAQLSDVPQPRSVRHKSHDLIVFSGQRRRGFVFEAKRWNYSPKAMAKALGGDADKLREMPSDLPLLGEPQKYILLFSHERSEGENEAELARFRRGAGLELAGRAAFPSRFRVKDVDARGLFVMTALEVVAK